MITAERRAALRRLAELVPDNECNDLRDGLLDALDELETAERRGAESALRHAVRWIDDNRNPSHFVLWPGVSAWLTSRADRIAKGGTMTSADDARLVADLAAAGTKRALAIENTRELADLLTLPAYARMPSELRTFPDLIQGTDEWHEQRRGMITASLIGNLITTKTLAVANNDTSRGLIAQLAAERITGRTDPNYVNDDMLRGIEDEPRAVDVYSKHFAPVTPDGFLVRSWGRFELGYSADGLVGEDGLIEVKSRRAKAQVLTVVSGEVPAANMAQLMAGLFVSGRDWIDYVSYSGGMHMWVTRVYPDPKWFEAIAAAVEAFEDSVTDVINKYNAGTVGMPMTERIELEMTI